ncbi:MAG: reprolysin-like metallopeptidase [Planctomycetota bacterium]
MSRKCVWSGVAAACVLAAMCGGASGQISERPESKASRAPDGIAVRIEGLSRAERQAEAWVRPKRHATARFDSVALRRTLSRAPQEGELFARVGPEVITLLSPEGEWVEFGVYESPIMAPELQAKFPEIRTYAGAALDDPSTTVRLSMTPAGMAAQVLAPSDRWFLDRLNRDDDSLYASYRKRDARNPGAWGCELIGELGMDLDPAAFGDLPPMELNSGQTLRTYRTAVACTGEYAQFHGGTVNSALAAIVTAMNRVTGLYEREVAVRLVLVADNDQIIYTNGGTDPYSNNDGGAMLNQNISTLNSVLGSGSYDIGHVFSTGGGGVAFLGVVCTSSKAGGVTGLPSPIGDPFYVDYVAHEMGHQFGATHTFNSSTSSCGFGNRTGSTAYEVGSGTTIMGYAGICGSDNTQNNSDDYFHSASYDQIIAYINGTGDSCGVDTATGNLAPSAEAGPGYTIPAQTPFALTASGSDPDGGSVTYCWEQRDLGPSTTLGAADNGSSPLFRSFDPTASPTRFFPSLPDVVFDTNPDDEVLPSTNRSMTFRVTVRDNQLNGGGVAFDETTLSVTTSAGPFRVTSQSSGGQTFEGSLPVTWDVAGTDGAAVNCQTVDILLSTNNGQSFDLVLVEGTPNDGNESVVLPIAASNARVMVRASDNVFFAIGAASFGVEPGDIAILLPDGAPDLADPGVSTSFPVEIVEGGSTLAPGSAEVVYGTDGTADTSVLLSDNGGGEFTATLPPFRCDDDVVYFVRAEAANGTVVETPEYSLSIGGTEITFSDDFQLDNGWVPTSEAGVTAGAWERGVPVGGDRGDPSADADGSGICWLTQNDLGPSGDGNSDVDGGEVTLTSPVFDLSGGGDFSYSYWLGDIAGGPLGAEDGFFVDVSINGGGSWTRARDYGSSGTSWRRDTIRFGDTGEFAASDTVRLRFIVADNSPGDVVEGGLDEIEISAFVCVDTDPCLVADQTTGGTNPGDASYGVPDGVVNTADLSYFVEQWLAGAIDTDVTTNGANPGEDDYGVPDGVVNTADLSYFVELWLGC